MNNNLYNSLDEGRHRKGKMMKQWRVQHVENSENRHLVERREERREVKQQPEVERELLIQPLKCAEHWGGRKRQYNNEGNGTNEQKYRLCRDTERQE